MLSVIINSLIDNWIHADIINESDRDIYEYGLELILYSIVSILSVVVTALLINKTIETLLLLAVTIPMQSVGGGYHAETHLRCFLIMYVGWWCAIFIIPFITPLCATILIFTSVITVFVFAPVRHKNVPMSAARQSKMRKLSRVTVVCLSSISLLFVWCFTNCLIVGIHLAVGLGGTALSMIIAKCKSLAIPNIR